jgi:hypothetical protein
MFKWELAEYNGADFFQISGGGAYAGNTSAINGFRVAFASGNITSGTVALYGLRPN